MLAAAKAPGLREAEGFYQSPGARCNGKKAGSKLAAVENREARSLRTTGDDTGTTQTRHRHDTEASAEKPSYDYGAQWRKGVTAGSGPATELRAEQGMRRRGTARRRRSIPYVGSTRASDASRGEAPPFSTVLPFSPRSLYSLLPLKMASPKQSKAAPFIV